MRRSTSTRTTSTSRDPNLPLTGGSDASIDGGVKRLELVRVRVCQRCGRGRAELEGADGAALAVPLDPLRAHELERQGAPDDVPWLSGVLFGLVKASGGVIREVVLDADPRGLRALVSISRGDDVDVVACTPQEGVGIAARGRLPLYATADALATPGDEPDASGHDRLH
jgi:hypothetical protein